MTETKIEVPEGYILWEDLKREVDAARTPEERREYEEAGPEVEAQIMLAELVYKMRTEAGISQTELARRMGISQPFISDIERGGRTPTVATLNRIAHATDHRLRLVAEPA
jgi:ribosome-binding protein aMBF1 (putative translation factor)